MVVKSAFTCCAYKTGWERTGRGRDKMNLELSLKETFSYMFQSHLVILCNVF